MNCTWAWIQKEIVGLLVGICTVNLDLSLSLSFQIVSFGFFIVLSQGTLKGFDQTINLILDESHERVYSTGQGVEQVILGLYIVRGDNVYVLIMMKICFIIIILNFQLSITLINVKILKRQK